jgi:hypothetical protein
MLGAPTRTSYRSTNHTNTPRGGRATISQSYSAPQSGRAGPGVHVL